MASLVIKSTTGVLIAALEVAQEHVIETLRTWVSALQPDTLVILDDTVLTPADKQRLCPTTGASPRPLDDFQHGMALLRQAEWELLQHVQQRTREMADECVRQRMLMHQCLRDVDLVDRSILATATSDQFNKRIAAATAATGQPPGEPPPSTLHNVMLGMQQLVNGRRKP